MERPEEFSRNCIFGSLFYIMHFLVGRKNGLWRVVQEYYGLQAALGERPGCGDSLHQTEVPAFLRSWQWNLMEGNSD